MPKIKLDAHLYDRAKKVAGIVGYSGVDEFIIHLLEKELSQLEAVYEIPVFKTVDKNFNTHFENYLATLTSPEKGEKMTQHRDIPVRYFIRYNTLNTS